MKRSRFIGLFGVAATSAAALEPTPAEVAEDAEICAFAGQLIQNYISANFKAVAQVLHHTALKLVYDSVSTAFEKLSEKFGEGRARQVSGLSGHPRTLGLDPSAFFVHIYELMESKHPGFTAITPERSLKIIGGIIDPQGFATFAHVLYDFRGSLRSATSETPYVQPRTLVLVCDRGRWFSYSAMGIGMVLGFLSTDSNPSNDAAKPLTK
jgi:hypothetical protein